MLLYAANQSCKRQSLNFTRFPLILKLVSRSAPIEVDTLGHYCW